MAVQPCVCGGRKNAIAKIRFGYRAQARNGARSGKPLNLCVFEMSRMDQAPAFIDISMIHQPFHWSLTAPCDTGLDLAKLFCDVNMNWATVRYQYDGFKLMRRDSA